MSTAYEYVGLDPRDYPGWGLRVQPGDVVYLNGRPPADGRFRVWDGTGEAPEQIAVANTEPPSAERARMVELVKVLMLGEALDAAQEAELLALVDADTELDAAHREEVRALLEQSKAPKRPNKAASAEDWRAYAVAMGMSPEDAAAMTRAALIEKYTGEV